MMGKARTGRGGRRALARSEWIVMRAVWRAVESEPEVAVSEVLPHIGKARTWHVSTVKTMMERLVDKGYLASRIRGKTCFYRPLVTQERAARRSVGEVLDTVLDGAFGPLVAYLADRRNLTDEQVRELQQLLGDDE
jgi:predicted transcriptional regulator